MIPSGITPRQFQESDGVDDWREVGSGACACFRPQTLDAVPDVTTEDGPCSQSVATESFRPWIEAATRWTPGRLRRMAILPRA